MVQKRFLSVLLITPAFFLWVLVLNYKGLFEGAGPDPPAVQQRLLSLTSQPRRLLSAAKGQQRDQSDPATGPRQETPTPPPPGFVFPCPPIQREDKHLPGSASEPCQGAVDPLQKLAAQGSEPGPDPPGPDPPSPPDCDVSPSDCAFHFEGFQGGIPSISLRAPGPAPDSPLTPAVQASIMGSAVPATVNSERAEYPCHPGGALAPNDQFYGSGRFARARTFQKGQLEQYADTVVKLQLSAAAVDVFGAILNLNKGDGNTMIPEDKRCLLFRVSVDGA